MPNEEQNLKHSFSDSYEGVVGPQELKEVGAGYIALKREFALELLETALKVRRRRQRMGRRRANKFYMRKKVKKALETAPVHPTGPRQEVLATEEAASLA